MTRSFNGEHALGDFAKFLMKEAAGAYKQALRPVLDEIGAAVKAEVQKEIGEYQSAIGQYPATAPLSPVTIEIKTRDGLGKNGNPDTPLWASGEFHDDVRFQSDVGSLSVEIGTDKEYIKFTELGTADMPPRPVFGPAALRVMPQFLPALAAASAMGIAGGIWSGLGVKAITHTQQGDSAHLVP